MHEVLKHMYTKYDNQTTTGGNIIIPLIWWVDIKRRKFEGLENVIRIHQIHMGSPRLRLSEKKTSDCYIEWMIIRYNNPEVNREVCWSKEI
jgi:hypothetical protein